MCQGVLGSQLATLAWGWSSSVPALTVMQVPRSVHSLARQGHCQSAAGDPQLSCPRVEVPVGGGPLYPAASCCVTGRLAWLGAPVGIWELGDRGLDVAAAKADCGLVWVWGVLRALGTHYSCPPQPHAPGPSKVASLAQNSTGSPFG